MNADNDDIAARISWLVHRSEAGLSLADQERVRRALELMEAVHASQAARPDGPYLNHTLMVCERVLDWCPEAPGWVWCAALLHDAAEDGEGKLVQALRSPRPDTRAGRVAAITDLLGSEVGTRIDLLTNPELDALGRAERDRAYATHVHHAVHADPWVAAIKFADWSTNGLALHGLPDGRRARLTQKYRPVAQTFYDLLSTLEPAHPLAPVAHELRERVAQAWSGEGGLVLHGADERREPPGLR